MACCIAKKGSSVPLPSKRAGAGQASLASAIDGLIPNGLLAIADPAHPLTQANQPLFSAVILAGGASRRMGRDKAWLELEGKPLLQHALDKVRALAISEVYISGRPGVDYSAYHCQVLQDLEPGFGPMSGIERALFVSAAPLLLVLAVDLPRMSPDFLARLQSKCNPLTGVVPVLREQVEPLAAIYPKRCHVLASSALAKGQREVHRFANACREERAVRRLVVHPGDAPCFLNWNCPEDFTCPTKAAAGSGKE